jgi:hypothetical protein
MDGLQDSVQIQQPVLSMGTAPLLQVSSFSAPSKEEIQQVEDREPLRVISSNDKENTENPEQEQEESGESGENGDKIADYVAKVLEKLVKQKSKMAKLTSVLEKKGLLTERRLSQDKITVQETATEETDKEAVESEVPSNNTKENLSPIKSKPEPKVEPLIPSVSSKVVLAEKKPAVNFKLEDVLQISRKEISYGYCFPGQIIEESLDIVNKSSHDFVVQIVVNCLNDELQDTEEYVFSVRRSHLYDYNDKHYLIMAPYSVAGFKFAMKVPNVRINGKIVGQVQISVQGATGSYTLDLSANVTVPKVFCPKELAFKGLDYKVVKLAIKEGKKQEFKIPIRNQGVTPVTLELEFHEPEGKRDVKPLFDYLVHPNVITVAPNSNTLTSVLVKPCKSMSSRKDVEKPKSERKILVGRVKDSALIYSFVFWIEVY